MHLPSPRLVATLGPRSFDCSEALAATGDIEFRLNASHMTPEEVHRRCESLVRRLPHVPCIIDLQGKKMRIGSIATRELAAGETVEFSCDPTRIHSVYVPHPELFDRATFGERLTLDDGRIEVEVVARQSMGLVARVVRAGTLHARKGINRVTHPLEPEDLCLTDQRVIELCQALDGVAFAVSFASDGTEAHWVRSRAPSRRVILKVERQEALDNLDALAELGDELWICRGDLGAQLGFTSMARQISRLDPRRYSTPILMAGQVLEHLTTHEVPTRSEVCHLTDLVLRGYAGVVLSDETAIGNAPTLAAEWAIRLMRDALAPEPREICAQTTQ